MKKLTKDTRRWIWLSVFIVLVLVVDQISKAHVIAHIPYGSEMRLIPGVLHLTYLLNEGAAFSVLSGMTWLFVVIVFLFLGLVGYLIYKKILKKPFELWCTAAIVAGAIGNLIDRIFRGKVVDMIDFAFLDIPVPSFKGGFHFEMTHFAIFNIADAFITCAVIALIVYVLFFMKDSKTEAAAEGEAAVAPAGDKDESSPETEEHGDADNDAAL